MSLIAVFALALTGPINGRGRPRHVDTIADTTWFEVDDPEHAAHCGSLAADANRVLAAMPPAQRRCWELRQLEQCSYELRRAEAMYREHGVPVINSSTKSVEEMSTVILQLLKTAR